MYTVYRKLYYVYLYCTLENVNCILYTVCCTLYSVQALETHLLSLERSYAHMSDQQVSSGLYNVDW